MGKANYISMIAELSESEGVFTTAQAQRMGIPRDALHDAVESGRIERIMRGAYRLVGSGASYVDELVAIWKLTAPSRFTYERMRVAEWDGVAVGGHTAASLLGIGDFYLTPYRFYAPKRFNTRNSSAIFTNRTVSRDEVSFLHGFPVTSMERTIFDLVVDDEDRSLVENAINDALHENRDFSFDRLSVLLRGRYPEGVADEILKSLMTDSGLCRGGEGA